ncbi:MAG: hypothetical protein HOV83_17400 [Catenulispora sp.]|nr:hypothetical protein [Catenulispora sp.]
MTAYAMRCRAVPAEHARRGRALAQLDGSAEPLLGAVICIGLSAARRNLPSVDDELPLGVPPLQQPATAAATTAGLELDMSPWLTDPKAVARFRSKVYTGGGPGACHPWLRAISSSGHGKFHLGSGSRQLIVLAHRFAFQLLYGPIQPSPPNGQRLGIMHLCDEHSCCNATHMRWETTAVNTSDYYERGRLGLASPLTDPRGRRARAVAIRTAILNAGADDDAQLLAFRKAIAVPRPWLEAAGQLTLFT